RRTALIRELLRPLRKQPRELLSFEEIRRQLHLRHLVDRGIQDTPVDRIVGSLGRADEFDREFLPRREALRERWEQIEDLAEGPTGFPPVELYKVGEAYFVVDGHHRISVARSLEAPTIEARVQEFQTSVPLGADDSPDEIVRKQGLADFLEATTLETTDAGDFRVTLPYAYQRLLEHICVHRYYRGLEMDREFSWHEAVASWRDLVFRPTLETIRRHDLMSAFPNRTETDLYLYVMDNLHYLREEYGPVAPQPDEAVRDLKRSQARDDSLFDRLTRRRTQDP
ncbi:MAG: hypothetical protein WBO53_16235, partial [Thermoanaerobaculia bacterium]